MLTPGGHMGERLEVYCLRPVFVFKLYHLLTENLLLSLVFFRQFWTCCACLSPPPTSSVLLFCFLFLASCELLEHELRFYFDLSIMLLSVLLYIVFSMILVLYSAPLPPLPSISPNVIPFQCKKKKPHFHFDLFII